MWRTPGYSWPRVVVEPISPMERGRVSSDGFGGFYRKLFSGASGQN